MTMEKDAILVAEIKYFPGEMPTLWSCSKFCHDEPKLNLLWLAHPYVDKVWDSPWSGDSVSSCIDENMSRDVRAKLNLPPIEFMQWFTSSCQGSKLVEDFPHGYTQAMWARARLANQRLLAKLGSNVYHFDFRAARK